MKYVLFYSKVVIAYEYHIFNPTIIDGHIGLFYNLNIKSHTLCTEHNTEACLQPSNLISYGYIFRQIFLDHEFILLLLLFYVIFEIKSKDAIPQNYNKRQFKIVWDTLFLNFCDLPQT